MKCSPKSLSSSAKSLDYQKPSLLTATKVIMITTMRQSDNFSIPSGRVHAARVQNRSRMNFESLTALLDEVAVEVVSRIGCC